MRAYTNPKYGAIYTELRNRLRYPKRLRRAVEKQRALLAARGDSEEEDSVTVKSSTQSEQSDDLVIDTIKPDGKGTAKQVPSNHDFSDEEEVNEKSVSFRTPCDDRDEFNRSHPLWAALAREDCPLRQVRSKYKQARKEMLKYEKIYNQIKQEIEQALGPLTESEGEGEASQK